MDIQQNIEDMEYLLYMDELERTEGASADCDRLTQYNNKDKIKDEEN